MTTIRNTETRSTTAADAAVMRTQEEIVTSPTARKVLGASRIVIGFYFVWAFLDKTFGLGFSTPSERAWIHGGKPAQGFMNGVEGPFAGFIKLFANPFGDVVFMIGLLGIGVALMTGAGLRIAAVAGTLLLGLMWLAEFPPANGGTNPFFDSHWIEAALIIISAVTLAGDTWGVGKLWGRIIGRHTWLR